MTAEPRRWTIRSGRTVFETKWIAVRDYDAVAPTGAPAPYGAVHMKHLALGVLPIDDQGRTILVGQQRFMFGRYSWELPEGGGPLDRPPLEGAQRELSEEAGLKAAHWAPLLSDVHLSNSVTDERMVGYLALGLSRGGGGETADDTEQLSLVRAPFREVLDAVIAGHIQDMLTVAMLLRSYHMAREGCLPGALTRAMLN